MARKCLPATGYPSKPRTFGYINSNGPLYMRVAEIELRFPTCHVVEQGIPVSLITVVGQITTDVADR